MCAQETMLVTFNRHELSLWAALLTRWKQLSSVLIQTHVNRNIFPLVSRFCDPRSSHALTLTRFLHLHPIWGMLRGCFCAHCQASNCSMEHYANHSLSNKYYRTGSAIQYSFRSNTVARRFEGNTAHKVMVTITVSRVFGRPFLARVGTSSKCR